MFVFQLKTKAAKVDADPYATIVQNTINFGQDLSKYKTPEQKAAAVQQFFEQGGVHREKSESKKMFGNVVFFDKEVDLQVGEKKVVFRGSQLTQPVTRRLNAGLYTFNYDTEKKALTLYSLNNTDEVVRIAGFGAPGGQFEQMDRLGKNTEILFKSLKSTSDIYKYNQPFAAFMEKAVSAIYGSDNAEFMPGSSSMQNKEALQALKGAMSNFITEHSGTKVLSTWKDMVHGMATTFNLGLQSPKLLDAIQSELRLEDKKNVDNFYVGFDINDSGRIAMNVFSYAEVRNTLVGGKAYNPMLMYQVVDGKSPAFLNSFTKHGVVNVDYDNANVKGEQYVEDQLTKFYSQNISGVYNIYAFATNVVAPIDQLSKDFDKAYSSLKK